MYFYLSKLLFLGFLLFKGNLIRGQNNSKYCDYVFVALTKQNRLRLVFNALILTKKKSGANISFDL